MLAWWTPGYDVRGDLNLDGSVNNSDFLILLAHWGNSAGQGVLSVIGNRKGYAGYEFEPALQASYSIYHVRRRVLNSDLGRWLTRDPLGYVDGANLYEYVRSNPLIGIDPSGTALPEYTPGGPGLRDKDPYRQAHPEKYTSCDPALPGSHCAGLVPPPGPVPPGITPCAGCDVKLLKCMGWAACCGAIGIGCFITCDALCAPFASPPIFVICLIKCMDECMSRLGGPCCRRMVRCFKDFWNTCGHCI
jgi:RHS repeat-associated protein